MSKTLTNVLGLVWIVIAVSFFAFSMIVGGAAITGKVVAGHYYVGSHGNYPEVSRGVYLLSAFLSAAFGLSLPALAGVMTWRESRKSSFNPLLWIGPFLALIVGLAFCYSSIHCIVGAFAGI